VPNTSYRLEYSYRVLTILSKVKQTEVDEVNLHYLRVFHEVAVRGSITRAAEQLRISQPAVSVQVKRLEGEMGLSLLRTEGRGIRLTETGEVVASYARRLFAVEQELERHVDDLRAGRAGALRIGATHLPGHALVPQLAATYKRAYPAVDVRVQTGNSRVIFDRLLSCEADVAVMAGGWDEPAIRREEVWTDELWFVVAADHPLSGREVTLQELATEPFLLREEGSSTRLRLLALFEMHGLQLTVGLEFAGLLETIKAVEAGYGVTLAPSLAVREQVQRGVLGRVLVPDVHVPMPIWLCTREGEGVLPAAMVFLEVVRAFAVGMRT
jgi:DNA-binding transcriptional LysR family regulator